MVQNNNLSLAEQFVVFSQQLAALIENGSSLIRALKSLEQPSSPYGEAASFLREQLESGVTLSQSLAQRPELFSSGYVNLIHAGEIGGILELTMRAAANFAMKEVKWIQALPPEYPRHYMIAPNSQRRSFSLNAFTPYSKICLMMFFETFALFLASGMGIVIAMGILAEMMPEPLSSGIRNAQVSIKTEVTITNALSGTGIVPAFAIELIATGEINGTLEFTLQKAAELLEIELNFLR